jgi:hypothetical protein
LLQIVPGSAQSELSTQVAGVGVGVAAPTTHMLATQALPEAQAFPQVPQLFESPVVSVHPVSPPQSVWPTALH